MHFIPVLSTAGFKFTAQQDELLSHNYDFKLQQEIVCFMPTGYTVRPIQCMENVNKQAMYKCQTERCQRSGNRI